jgi:hypothetical protein
MGAKTAHPHLLRIILLYNTYYYHLVVSSIVGVNNAKLPYYRLSRLKTTHFDHSDT